MGATNEPFKEPNPVPVARVTDSEFIAGFDSLWKRDEPEARDLVKLLLQRLGQDPPVLPSTREELLAAALDARRALPDPEPGYEPGWLDAALMNALHPETFEAPHPSALDRVRPGWYVQVCARFGDDTFSGERFWVLVDGIERHEGEGRLWMFTGRVENDLVRTERHGLARGDRVQLEWSYVLDVCSPARMTQLSKLHLPEIAQQSPSS